MIDKEFAAQIQLLEDPDKQIFSMIREQIVKQGKEVVPILEQAWGSSTIPLVHKRIEDIIHEINFNQIVYGIKEWLLKGHKDWFSIMFLMSKFYFQNIKKEELKAEILKIRNDIWLELNDNLTALEKIKIINHIFYSKYKFAQNTKHKNSKNNFFISELLSTKRGNDLSLGLLYLMLCESLDLPVYGVALPGNFILTYLNSPIDEEDYKAFKNDALFYINPLTGGAVFGMNEIDTYLEKNKIKATENYYNPANNLTILKQYIERLISVMNPSEEKGKIEELEQIKQLLLSYTK